MAKSDTSHEHAPVATTENLHAHTPATDSGDSTEHAKTAAAEHHETAHDTAPDGAGVADTAAESPRADAPTTDATVSDPSDRLVQLLERQLALADRERADRAAERAENEHRFSALGQEISRLTMLYGSAGATAETQRLDAARVAAENKMPALPALDDERAAMASIFADQPRVNVMIPMDEADIAFLKVSGKAPVWRGSINGVGFEVRKGDIVSVPQNVAEIYQHQINPWSAQGVVKPVTFDVAEARIGLAA